MAGAIADPARREILLMLRDEPRSADRSVITRLRLTQAGWALAAALVV
jgi:DNA-binding transcriptional ArsR family regulator